MSGGLLCASCGVLVTYRQLAHFLVCRMPRLSPCCQEPRLNRVETPQHESGED